MLLLIFSIRIIIIIITINHLSFPSYPIESQYLPMVGGNMNSIILVQTEFFYKNFIDVVNGNSDTLVPDPENYDKFHMKNIVEWWKKKATNRFISLKNENRVRTEIEVWTSGKEIDIIR